MNSTPPVVVIDTSVLRPILIREQPESHPLCLLWQSGEMTPAVDDATIKELEEVLYRTSPTPKPLQAQRFVKQALRCYMPWTTKHPVPTLDDAPVCPDPKDQKFIDLATSVQARFLITEDTTVLAMQPQVAFTICTAAQYTAAL